VKVVAKGSEPVNQYKERLLNTLSLARGLNLRNKVLQRYALLPGAMATRLPGMEEIIAHSIRARNYFVHGSETKFSVEVACGWNSERWVKEGFTRSRLKWYIMNFAQNKGRVFAALKGGPIE